MKLIDLLAPDRIVLGAKGDIVRDVAIELIHAVIVSGRATDPDRLEELLVESLPGEAVTVGQRAFVLHFRTEAVDGVTAALGVTAAPVHREHDPGKEARIVLLLLAPPREGPAFLGALGAFIRALADDEVVTALAEAESPEAVLAIAPLAEINVSGDLLVSDVLIGRVVSAGPDTTIGEACALLERHRLPALPIVSEEREVLGMVTYRELLKHLLPGLAKRKSGELGAEKGEMRDRREAPVRDVMDRSVLCISEDQSLADVASLMVNKNLDRVPVVREGALVGLLTGEHIVRRLFGP